MMLRTKIMKIVVITLVLMMPASLFAHDHPSPSAKADAVRPGTSLYNVTTQWTAEDGHHVTLADFEGRPVVITMAYTSCKDICPLIVANMMRIEDEALILGAHEVTFLFVSLDPARDTPDQLKAYATRYGLDLTRWSLLQGDAKSVRLLAAALGIRFRWVDKTTIDHSTVITLLDSSGRVIMQTGTDQIDQEKLVERLVTLSQQR